MQTAVFRTFLLLTLSCSSLFAGGTSPLTEQETSQGWKLLFNGEDLSGWRIYGKKDAPGAGWKAEDGILRKVPNQFGGNIITTETFRDYELSWEWKIDPKGNNGIKYLVTEDRPSSPGPEYQMLDDDGHPDARVGPQRQTGSLYDIIPPSKNKTLKPVGEWNHSQIIVRGKNVEHWLNGEKVVSFRLGSRDLRKAVAASKFKNEKDFDEKTDGHIMLTDHVDGCSFRNIKIRPL